MTVCTRWNSLQYILRCVDRHNGFSLSGCLSLPMRGYRFYRTFRKEGSVVFATGVRVAHRERNK